MFEITTFVLWSILLGKRNALISVWPSRDYIWHEISKAFKCCFLLGFNSFLRSDFSSMLHIVHIPLPTIQLHFHSSFNEIQYSQVLYEWNARMNRTTQSLYRADMGASVRSVRVRLAHHQWSAPRVRSDRCAKCNLIASCCCQLWWHCSLFFPFLRFSSYYFFRFS